MKTLKNSLLTILLMCLGMFSIQAQNLTADEIIKKSEQKNRGETAKGEMTMKVVRPGWSRTISMKYWSKGKEYFLILITAPAKEEGQTFLKIENDMWHWIPDIQSMVKIPPSMMMQSWMGSDFTNDDLVKESSISEDYDQELLGSETIRGKECYKIKLTPKPEAAVVWGKIITWIIKDDFNQWKSNFYDEDGELVHTQNNYDIKKMDERSIPTRMEIIPANEPGNKTIMYIKEAIYNEPIKTGFFSKQNMKRVDWLRRLK